MLDIASINYIRCYALLIMNYRLLLTEMLIDYKERRGLTKCGKTYKVYTHGRLRKTTVKNTKQRI